jgi:hypothetical protein
VPLFKPTPIVQTFVINPTSKLGGPKPKKNKPNITECVKGKKIIRTIGIPKDMNRP